MNVVPREYAEKIGDEIVVERGVAAVGLSVGNSFFSSDNIASLLNFCNERFSRTILVPTDGPARHTFEAIGYSAKEAKAKARHQGNTLRNRCRHILGKKTDWKTEFAVVDWDLMVFPHDAFRKQSDNLNQLYVSIDTFKEDLESATWGVLFADVHNTDDVNTVIKRGVRYLIEELAFIMACPEIFSCSRICNVYHRYWEIYDNLVSGFYDGIKRTQYGSLVFKGAF